jgi:cysteine synthase A
MKGAIEKANELHVNTENSFIPSQFDNPANTLAHYNTTGPEIWCDTDGQVAAFIAGVGTGATVSGTGKYLKEQNSDVKIIAVEPTSSPMITKGKSAPHKIQGIGANFIPENYKAEYVDEVIPVSSEDAYKYGKEVAAYEGILVGISSGANLAAAVNIAKRGDFDGKIIVCIAADSGEHYLSVEDYL